MKFWLNLFVICVIAFLVLSFFGVYSGEAVKKIVRWGDRDKKSHIGGPEGAPSGRCVNDLWCRAPEYTSSYYCKNGSVYRNQTLYRCDTTLQLCIPRENFKLVEHCNPGTICVDGISECQPLRKYVCKDSDQGRNRLVFGATRDSLGGYHHDICLNKHTLLEGYCNEESLVVTEEISCVCDSGKCL